MPVTAEEFGYTADGHQLVKRFTLTNGNGMVVKVINFGAALTELWVPDKSGKAGDVVHGWDTLKEYETNAPYFGVTIGRVADRIAKGQFTLDGVEYQLEVNNNGMNHTHGGSIGFSRRVWSVGNLTANGVEFTYVSPDGEEGYPGEVTVGASYELTEDNKLLVCYVATTTKTTLLNLTNHTYYNLNGHDSGSVLDHHLEIDADKYTPMDVVTWVPEGDFAPVDNTVYDFRKATLIGDRIHDVPGLGYDHNYCVKSAERPCARLSHKGSGRSLEVTTTNPCLRIYAGNNLTDRDVGKRGTVYPKHSGLCLETEDFSDAINKPNFPSYILRPGETYKRSTAYAFSWN